MTQLDSILSEVSYAWLDRVAQYISVFSSACAAQVKNSS
jgi:hypothetical protein